MLKSEELFLWIDEHSFQWRDMVMIICDLKEKIPIAIFEDHKLTTLQFRLQWLPTKIKDKIKWISWDMNKTYIRTFKWEIPWIKSTVDKYHLVQEVNRMMDDVRQLNKWLISMKFTDPETIAKTGKVPKKLLKKKKVEKWIDVWKYKSKVEVLDEKYFTKDELKRANWETIEFKEIKLEYFLEVKGWYKTLFMKREENLSGIQKLRLRQILREFDFKWYLTEAWVLKERFIDALNEKDWEEIKNMTQDALSSEHYRIKAFWRTLNRRKEELENFCIYSTDEFKFTNALTESVNNQCKVAKRVSHGFKNKKNYFKKLASRFVLLKKQHEKEQDISI